MARMMTVGSAFFTHPYADASCPCRNLAQLALEGRKVSVHGAFRDNYCSTRIGRLPSYYVLLQRGAYDETTLLLQHAPRESIV